MSLPKFIVIHCSANRADAQLTAEDIAAYHTRPKSKGGLGWQRPGYHFIIDREGSTYCAVQPWEKRIGEPLHNTANGAKGYNHCSIHICYIGGLDGNLRPADTRTPEQKEELRALVARLLRAYPTARVVGHRDLNPHKFCPCFEVGEEW